MWSVRNRGFLPIGDPIISLPITDIKNTELIYTWENLTNVLPHYIKEECLREELIYDLRKASQCYCHGFVDNLGGPSVYERVFLLMAYFATAYINSPEGKRKTKLPKEMTMPFARVAHLVSRQPVLDYTSFVLYNWRKKPNAINDIEILHTFTGSPFEESILKSLVEMEFIGGELINNISNPFTVAENLAKINNILLKVWSNIPPDFLEDWSSILTDYQDLIYEQWRPDALTFPCDIFLQAPLLAVLYRYLDINFQNDYLNKRRETLHHFHMSPSHRDFINSVSGIRNKCAEDESIKTSYNRCLEELIKLRNLLTFRNADKDMSLIATNELNTYYF